MDFSKIDKEKLEIYDQELLQEIETLFLRLKRIEDSHGPMEHISRSYFIFAYNLFYLDLFEAGLEMLKNVPVNYYEEEADAHLKLAVECAQKAADLKNAVLDSQIDERIGYEQESEVIEIMAGMFNCLPHFEFEGKEEFLAFRERSYNHNYEVVERPTIGLVED